MKNGFVKFFALLMAVLLLLAALPVAAMGTEEYSENFVPGLIMKSIIYPVEPAITYIFKNGEVEIARQIVKGGDILLEPKVQLSDHETFVGWEPAVTFGTVGSIAMTDTITVNAKIEDAYYVFFKDTAGNIVYTMQCADGDTIDASEFSAANFPVAADKGIVGWKMEGAEGEETLESVTINGANITLTAVVREGFWITYDSMGGSYIAPSFYLLDEDASAPNPPPTRLGYTFDGWYYNAACTGSTVEFSTIDSSTTVFAKWNGNNNISYTVIYWWQNANDDGYSYHESDVSRKGKAGDNTNAIVRTYNGFELSSLETKPIAGDGSTIVNVKYNRIQCDVIFYEREYFWGGWEWVEVPNIRITAKYGANIKDQWPKTSDGRNTTWRVANSGSTAQSGLEVMPLGGKNFYGKLGNSTDSMYYYIEKVGADGEYVLDHIDSVPPDRYVSKEEQYEIMGFAYDHGTGIGESATNASFYYNRGSYKVIYIGGAEQHEKSYKYEEDISGAGVAHMPDAPEGKEDYDFGGWYADPAFTELYNFTDKTMPANNITVYAKWNPPTYKVRVYNWDETILLDTITVTKGNTISEEKMPPYTPPEGETFLGWVNMDDNKPFNFDTQINQDYDLYAKVGGNLVYAVKYDGNEETAGTAPADNWYYAIGAAAQVKSSGDLEKSGCVFLGWSLKQGAKNVDYWPGGMMNIMPENDPDNDRVITLYAVWEWQQVFVDVTIAKQVTGSLGDKDKEFDFTVTIDGDAPIGGGDGNYTLSEDGKKAIFNLKHNESVMLCDVPIGVCMEVSEAVYTGYTTTWRSGTETGETNKAILTAADGMIVTFTNSKNALPDTGVLLDSLPYILILAVVIGIGIFVSIRKRRNRDY